MRNKKIAYNVAFLIVGKILYGLLSVLTLAIIARYLGVLKYGSFSFCLAYYLIFQIISIFGVDSILIRAISRQDQQISVLLGQGLLLKGALAFSCYILGAVSSYFIDNTSIDHHLILIFLLCLFSNVIGTPRVVYEVKLESVYPTIVELLSKVLFLVLVLVGIHQEFSLLGLAWLYVGTDFLVGGVLYLMSRRSVRPSFYPNRQVLVHLYRECWPVAFTNIFIVIYFRIDIVLLQVLRGSQDVGYYNAAYFILSGMTFIPEALSRSIFPVLSESFHNSPVSFVKLFRRSFKFIVTLCLPIAFAVFLFGSQIIRLLYGEPFDPAIGALKILSIAIAMIFMGYIVSTTLLAMDRQKLLMWVALSNAAINVTLNILLIPRWGYTATSVTTVLTEGIGCLVNLVLVLRFMGVRSPAKFHARYLAIAGALLMQYAVVRVGHALSFLIILPVSFAAYASALLAFQWLDDSEWSLLRSLLTRSKFQGGQSEREGKHAEGEDLDLSTKQPKLHQ